MKKLLSVLMAVAACAVSFAQMPPAEPAAELKKLDYMVGEWSATGTFTLMGQEMPFKMTVKCSWDGQFLRQETINDMGDAGKMTETIMLGWDPAKSQYFSHAFTSLSALPRMEKGKLDGEKLVMTSDPWNVMGMDFLSRTTMWKSGSDMMFTMEFKEGDNWTNATNLTFKKK